MRRIIRIFCALAALLCLAACLPVHADAISLPSALIAIDEEAFMNVPISHLTIPSGTERIESKAFAGCGIQSVTLPKSITYIAPDAFGEVGDLWVDAPSGSYAETWAKEHDAILVRGLGVARHSQEEIRQFIAEHPVVSGKEETFRRAPTGGPNSEETYAPGLLSESSIQNALNMLNQLRYIAGLNANVINDPDWEEQLGAAALLNALNGDLSHYPERPYELLDSQYDALYESGKAGAGSSNLSAGYTSLPEALLGCVCDSGSNMKTVGHRRWILNPPLGKVAFGYCINRYTAYQYFSGMRAFDRSGSGGQTLVAWPAQQTPLTHYIRTTSHPWSLSFGRRLVQSAISVTLTRTRDGKTWHFSDEAADGSFYINNDGYGMRGCVIFLPDGLGSIKAGDTFQVAVEDLDQRIVVQYTVTFFNP